MRSGLIGVLNCVYEGWLYDYRGMLFWSISFLRFLAVEKWGRRWVRRQVVILAKHGAALPEFASIYVSLRIGEAEKVFREGNNSLMDRHFRRLTSGPTYHWRVAFVTSGPFGDRPFVVENEPFCFPAEVHALTVARWSLLKLSGRNRPGSQIPPPAHLG